MGEMNNAQYIGLNRYGDEVYEAGGKRILRREGVNYTEAGQEHLPAHMFLRIESIDDFKWCAKGLGDSIAADPTFRHKAVKQFIAALELPNQTRIYEFVRKTTEYLALGLRWEGNWEFLWSFLEPEISDAPPLPAVHEPDPILFLNIDGVITSLKTRMFRRTFDFDAINLIARLARRTGAKLILTSPMVQTWESGAEALQQKLIAEGWPADLWHREWMLPVSDATIWQELDAWLARRNCDDLSALIIAPDGNQYSGELPADVGDFYTFPADGFTQWNYFEILSMLGLSDNDVVPPPTWPTSGFQATPSKWRGRQIARKSSPRATYVPPSFPRPS